jgi:signal transduction histidine kinase
MTCDRQCERSDKEELQLCSYGLNFQRVDEQLLIAGLVVNDYPVDTKARKKMQRRVGDAAIKRKDLDAVLTRCREATDEIEVEIRARKDKIIEEYRETKSYQKEILEGLKPELAETLAQVHDYKQFVQQVVNNIDVMLEARYPGLPIEQKLSEASREEAAIYWAAVLMDEKLDAALFLESPKRIYEKREQGTCRLHGLVLKYVRIYQSRAERKKINLVVVGDSWGEIEGNTRAFGIIPHTLIDNAVKYAPKNSKVEVSFAEDADYIVLSVISKGPRIRIEERSRIFDLFYRGNAARRRFKDGTGFGLASAQNIAKAHDTRIEVEQAPEPDGNGDYLTTFSVRFKRARAVRTSPRGSLPTNSQGHH